MRVKTGFCILMINVVLSFWGSSLFAEERFKADVIENNGNPFARKIAVSFENLVLMDAGADNNLTYEQLKIKALLPNKVGDWWLAHRPILPIFYKQEAVGGESVTGLGDLSYRLYITPRHNDHFIWGIGPAFIFPTATEKGFGAEKWSVGPTIGIVESHDKWLIGLVALNVWSFAGGAGSADVNALQLIPAFSYIFNSGWLVGSKPEIFADWKSNKSNRWLIPIGGSIGRAFRMGDQSAAINVGGYYNVVRPDGASEWDIRISFDFIFRKGKK